VRLCSGKGAYEAIPDVPGRLDLARAARALEASGLRVTDARVMLIVSMDPEVTLSRDGRILVKTRDPALADQAIQELWRRIERGSGRPG
jgi:hypothetical protein